jgi:hypothetical protein
MQHDTHAIVTTASTIRRWLECAEELGDRDVYGAKRREPRTTWSVPLVFKPQSGPVVGETLYVKGKNLSVHGMAALSRKPVRAGTQIDICNTEETEWVSGRVVHCTATLGAFIIGIAFDRPTP